MKSCEVHHRCGPALAPSPGREPLAALARGERAAVARYERRSRRQAEWLADRRCPSEDQSPPTWEPYLIFVKGMFFLWSEIIKNAALPENVNPVDFPAPRSTCQ